MLTLFVLPDCSAGSSLFCLPLSCCLIARESVVSSPMFTDSCAVSVSMFFPFLTAKCLSRGPGKSRKVN